MEKETISQKLERFDSDELRSSLLFACMAGVVFVAMAIMAARQDYGWLLPLGFFFVIFGIYSLTFLAYARGWRSTANEDEEEEAPVIEAPLTPRTGYVQGPRAMVLNEEGLQECLKVKMFVELLLRSDPNNLTPLKKLVEGAEYDKRMTELAKLGIVNGGQGVRTRMLLIRDAREIWRRLNVKHDCDILGSLEKSRQINPRGKLSYSIRDNSPIEENLSNFAV